MFKKLKDKLKGDEQANSSSSPEIHHGSGSRYFGGGSSWRQQQYGTTPTEKYQSPEGPPPGYGKERNEGEGSPGQSSYASPSGPPPSTFPQQPPPTWDPPPYHDWTVIPDTALLPPPPSLGYDTSPTANASAQDGDRAKSWTDAHPLWPPQHLAPSTHAAIQNAHLALLKPPSFTGEVIPQPNAGHWRCRSHASCPDSSILTNLPLYAAQHDSPLVTGRPKMLYFELKVTGLGRGGNSPSRGEADAGIAIGFVAPPYPTFRLPGWERGSLGVHGDDGRKYVNDPWGGVDFTTAFQVGETVGVGIAFEAPREPPGYEAGRLGARMLDIEVFFTREGKRVGGWDGNEELDGRSEGGNVGLRGECDLFPAIGVFGGVDFEVMFHPGMWMYRPAM